VKHVLRDQRELNGAPRGNVQRVNLVLAARMLGLPHPLLAHHVNVHGVGRRRVHAEVKQRTPYEHDQEQAQRNDCPGRLEQRGALDLHRHRVALFPVKDGEARDQQDHERETDQAHQHHEEDQRVHLRRNGRGLRRKEREVRHPFDEKLPQYWTDVTHPFIRSPLFPSQPFPSPPGGPASSRGETSPA